MQSARILAIALLLAPAPAFAQASLDEIVVTAHRRDSSDYDERIPPIGLRRVADFAVQEVVVVGDTREAEKRNGEIFATIRGAIELAQKRGGIELATGELIVEPLTTVNYRGLTLAGDGRPDTGKATFLIKTRLSAAVDAKTALDRIEAFIKAVPTVGRAEMKTSGDLTLSVVGPDQYRFQIIDLISADAKATASKFGPEYRVEVVGADRPVEWSRASLTEVLLYLPYRYTVRAKGD